MRNHIKQLLVLRSKIDNIDDELLDLLAKRLQIVQKIGRFKHANKIRPFDKKRWNEVMQSIMSKAQSLGLSSTYIKRLYGVIHKHSLKLQKSIKDYEKS